MRSCSAAESPLRLFHRAARRGGLSREKMYGHLRTIEHLLDRDLENGKQRTALHTALTTLDVLRAG
jgi:purine catabolism regulator